MQRTNEFAFASTHFGPNNEVKYYGPQIITASNFGQFDIKIIAKRAC